MRLASSPTTGPPTRFVGTRYDGSEAMMFLIVAGLLIAIGLLAAILREERTQSGLLSQVVHALKACGFRKF